MKRKAEKRSDAIRHDSTDQKPKKSAGLKKETAEQPTNKVAASSSSSSSGNGPSTGYWKCELCGRDDFVSGGGFSSHRECCKIGCLEGPSVSLRPACLNAQRQLLSDFNLLVTDSVELIELSTLEDIERLQKSNKRRKLAPKVGNIGIRCRFCAQNRLMSPPHSNVYPQSLKSLSHNIYNLITRHLMSSCPNIPKVLQQQLVHDKQISTKQSMQKDRIGLPMYLQMLTKEFRLTDDGKNEGIRCSMGA